jgi:hypothetical protein
MFFNKEKTHSDKKCSRKINSWLKYSDAANYLLEKKVGLYA